jgi:hypothetical protein
MIVEGYMSLMHPVFAAAKHPDFMPITLLRVSREEPLVVGALEMLRVE